ncbi:MAG: hypothetical protein R3A52_26880 [Polyangiales bacterium]
MDDPTPQDPSVARHAGDDLDTLDGFVARFVWPLVAGGRVHVEDILGPGVIAQWARAGYGDASLTVRVGEALRKRLSRFGPAGVVERVPLDALALAAVWHNLLAMTHPEVVGRAGLRRRVREWCLSMLEWVDAPRARGEVALRHAMLGRLGELGRVDTHVEFWAGYADFIGVAPPKSLMAWPSVRRVNARRTRVGLFELVEALRTSRADPSVELVEVARAALALSPLTDLSLVDRPNLAAFAWTPSTVNLLGDMALRGAAQRAILAQGTPAARALEQATLTFMRGAQLARPVASAVLRMHLELLVMDGMAARMGAPQATSTSGVAGAASAPVAGAVSQPLALDAYLLLGPARAARWLGLDENTLARAVPPDPSRPTPRDPPSAPLLVAAGLMEART